VLAHGDVIVEVNRRPTPHQADYRKILSSLPDGQVAWLFVYRPRPEATFLAKVEVEKRPEKADKDKKVARKTRP
jgi:S1-C subfamily serine protease